MKFPKDTAFQGTGSRQSRPGSSGAPDPIKGHCPLLISTHTQEPSFGEKVTLTATGRLVGQALFRQEVGARLYGVLDC